MPPASAASEPDDRLLIEAVIARRSELMTVADHIPLFAGDPLLFEPGARWEYSNAGYIVLGRIIEVASGMSYYDFMQHHGPRPHRRLPGNDDAGVSLSGGRVVARRAP